MIVLLVLNDLVDYKMFEYLFRDKDFKKNVSWFRSSDSLESFDL